MAYTITGAVAGLTVEDVAPGHTAGAATLTVKSANTIAWTAAGGSEGDAVTINDGARVVVQDGTDGTNWAVISRDQAADLSGGPATVTITALKAVYDRLVEVDDAITEVVKAQSAGHGDAHIVRARLDALRAYRADLYRVYTHEQGLRPAAAGVDLTGNF